MARMKGSLRWAGFALASAAAATGWQWLQRDPLRNPPDDPAAILSPADGKVLLIVRDSAPAWVEGPAWRVAIFLSLLDVHVQRSPVSGRVGLSEYCPGGYRPAYQSQASSNAGHLLGLDTPSGRVLIIRSVGFIARRVTSCVNLGDDLLAGQRIGRILLGSRAEVIWPAASQPCIQVGEKVRAGESILAHW